MTEDSFVVGLIERNNKAEKEKRAKAKAAFEESQLAVTAGKAILASNCNLGGKELKALLLWYLGPCNGTSGMSVAQLKARWDEVQGQPPPALQPHDEEEPLPYASVLERVKAHLANTPVCFPAPAPLGPAVGSGDVEGMSMAQLDAMMAVAAAQKARLVKKAAEEQAEAARQIVSI